ncbi:hypothetical protein BG74_00300 [Sodalis-like endosymbiont of Proechinophthirus fluctus]|nr:hypothetical protein BG74_00300 [Sodalis-like endosymbiont of Proechinophthirus fluctus]
MDWLVVSLWLLAGLFFVAVMPGFTDTLACSGFITISALLAERIAPRHLATNKLQSVDGSFSANLYLCVWGW